MRSSRVRRGKTRNASRFGAAISAGLDGGLVALRERLIALGVGTHPALGRRAGERAAHLRRRAERAQSCTLAPRCTTIGLKSPRSTALYQTEARSSIVTSPMITAVGAMNAVG